MSVAFLWCGAPTTSTLRPIFGLSTLAGSVRGVFSENADLSSPIYTAGVSPDNNYVCRPGDAVGLKPDTRYYYAAEIDGVVDTANVARARTLPARRRSAKITFGSCWAATGQQYHGLENHPVGAAIAGQHDAGALMHLFCGDMGYLDNEIADLNPWADNFPKLHAMPYFAQFARSSAWDCVWDDHDFGGNDSNGLFSRKDLAASTWRQFVPMFNLPEPYGPIYHAFDLMPGVRVVVSDLRYDRGKDSDIEGPGKSMMSTTQKAWLKNEWLAAKQAGKLILWVTSSMWGIDGSQASAPGTNTDGDGWWRFTTERNELDEFRSVNGITDIVILTGDGHQISYRTNVDYSSAQNVPAPVYACAAYSRAAAYRPAAWNATSTYYNCDGHYAVLTLDPISSHRGWRVTCEFHTVNPSTQADIIEFSTSQDVGSPVPCGVGANKLGIQGGDNQKHYVAQPE